MLPFFLFAACCYLVAPYLGLSSRDVDPRIAELWPPGGVGFVPMENLMARADLTIGSYDFLNMRGAAGWPALVRLSRFFRGVI